MIVVPASNVRVAVAAVKLLARSIDVGPFCIHTAENRDAVDARPNQVRIACGQADCTPALHRICGQAEGEALALHLAPGIRIGVRGYSAARNVAPVATDSAIGFSGRSRGSSGGGGCCRSGRCSARGGGSRATTGSAGPGTSGGRARTGCRCARRRWAPGRRLAARRRLLAGSRRRRAIHSASGGSWLNNGSGHSGWRWRGGRGRHNHSGGRGWHNHSSGLRGGRWLHNGNLRGRSRRHRGRSRTASQQQRPAQSETQQIPVHSSPMRFRARAANTQPRYKCNIPSRQTGCQLQYKFLVQIRRSIRLSRAANFV